MTTKASGVTTMIEALKPHHQFILFRTTPSQTRPGKADKIPCGITGKPCNAQDPANWLSAEAAQAAAKALGLGVGFVLTPSDPFFCLDLDACREGDGWSAGALALVARFPGACVEVSQSGNGLHVWGSYTGATRQHGCRNAAYSAELYTSRRFVALGHPGATGDAGADCTAALNTVVAELFPPTTTTTTTTTATTTRTDGGTDPADDEALIARMLAAPQSAQAAFGGKASFQQLWDADADALGRAFPDAGGSGRAFDASAADAALAQHLAYWTANDAARMGRLMHRSALKRDKWERADYLQRTIQKATERQGNVWQPQVGRQAATASGWNIAPFEDCTSPDLSHDQLALDLGHAGWAKDARHVPAWGCWLFWNGTRWAKDERLQAMTAIRDYLRAKAGQLVEWSERKAAQLTPDEAQKLLTGAKRKAADLRSAPMRAAVELTARSNEDLVAVVEQFDASPDLLGVPSGAVDLQTGDLRAPDRADYTTKSAAIDPAPTGTSAPLWLSFLARVFDGDREMIGFVQRAAGYALTGHTREQKLLFLYGNGANGKSVFLNTLQYLLADYAKRAPAETFLDSKGERHPTELAGLRGARLVVGSELPPGRTWNDAVIKDLTGGDVITARYMRGDFFEFTPQFSLFIAGNHLPTFRGVDEAIRRRVLLVPFTVTIPAGERDPELPDKLKAEGGAILRWCIDGAVAWYREGLNPPASVTAASADYLDGEDLLGEFLTECLAQSTGNSAKIADVYPRFVGWAAQRGLHTPWSQHALTRALGERGLSVKHKRDGRHLLDHALQAPVWGGTG